LNKGEIVRAIQAERRLTLAFLRGLEPDQFDAATALPGWRIRETIAHLITTDRASVTGSNLLTVLGSMGRLERWNDRQVPKWANRPIPELLLGLDRWGRRLLRLARSLPSPVYRLRVPSIFGRAPAGLLLWSRVYDEWIHRQDMRRALGLPDEEVDLASPSEFLLTAIVSAVLPALQGRAGALKVSLKGAPLPEWRYDPAAGSGAPEKEPQAAAATITASAPSFIMAAAGRDSFEALQRQGSLVVEGDESLASEFLANLRVV
jgi:uncharacterized protein (TIGR03083 family)